ncbi:MAG: hypothetical protein K6G40_09630 [Eubacterium sp.]|nr:hypothetical protein [Eubacterium sp.]
MEMMGILLTVLKIIGIVLLVVFCALVILLFCICFVPVKYDIYAENNDEFSAGFKVSYMLHLIRAGGRYDKDGLTLSVKALWFSIIGNNETSKSTEEIKPFAEELKPKAEEFKQENVQEHARTQTNIQDVKRPEEDEKHEEKIPVNEKKPKKDKKPKRDKKPLKDNIIFKIKKVWDDEYNKDAIKHVFNVAVRLLKKVFPDSARGDLLFSLGSPDLTGQCLGIISLIPMFMDKRLHIGADFESEDPYVKGNIRIMGSIRLYIFILAFIELIRDKKIRRLIKKIRA